MKLSIFTTVTNAIKRGDNFLDAYDCYSELADQLVVVRGGKGDYVGDTNVNYEWPQEFSFEFIGQQFTRGYEACTGDWVIHADLDFIFHEKDFEKIRQVLSAHPSAPALSFYKYQFILPDRYNLKSRLVVAVNKGEFGDRIKFDSGGDLCQPSLDGKELKPDDVPESGVALYNYEKMTKTEAQIKDDVQRMARAWHTRFGNWHLGTTDTSYDAWLQMVTGRFTKPQKHIKLGEHPKYVQETIMQLRPDQWGYNGFNHLPINDYAKDLAYA